MNCSTLDSLRLDLNTPLTREPTSRASSATSRSSGSSAGEQVTLKTDSVAKASLKPRERMCMQTAGALRCGQW